MPYSKPPLPIASGPKELIMLAALPRWMARDSCWARNEPALGSPPRCIASSALARRAEALSAHAPHPQGLHCKGNKVMALPYGSLTTSQWSLQNEWCGENMKPQTNMCMLRPTGGIYPLPMESASTHQASFRRTDTILLTPTHMERRPRLKLDGTARWERVDVAVSQHTGCTWDRGARYSQPTPRTIPTSMMRLTHFGS